jgi:hypothetical protein
MYITYFFYFSNLQGIFSSVLGIYRRTYSRTLDHSWRSQNESFSFCSLTAWIGQDLKMYENSPVSSSAIDLSIGLSDSERVVLVFSVETFALRTSNDRNDSIFGMVYQTNSFWAWLYCFEFEFSLRVFPHSIFPHTHSKTPLKYMELL